MRFSYSKLNVFLTCPLQFKYKYIDKDKEEEVTDSYSTYLGRSVHEALYELYNNKDQDLEWLEDRWAILSMKIIEEAKEKSPHVFPDNKTINMFKNHGRKILRIFFESNKEMFQDPNHTSIALEKAFSAQFKEFILTGIIDKVEKMDSEIYVVDYKTGKALTQKEVDDNLQLSFYAVACRRAGLPLSSIQFCMHYVKDNIRVYTTRTIEDIKRLYGILKDVQFKIKNNQFDPTPSKSSCLYCGYKKHCPVYKKDKTDDESNR